MLQRPRGTRDFLPDEMEARREIEGRMREAARRFGYGQVRTPVFEELELFTLRSGPGIVNEMYAFEDKGGRALSLRPELTAPVLRLYVNEARVLPKPLRWYYFDDCFRYERPQKGRYRQFWQFGAELIGADTAMADAEVILLADAALRAAGVEFELKVGHLALLRSLLADLEEGPRRAVMALLDKREFGALSALLGELGRPDLADPLGALVGATTLDEAFAVTGPLAEEARLRELVDLLDAAGLRYTLNFGIVRGLDYYTGMVFEGFAPNLGAENQIVGGGAYRLAHLFGGEDTPSCGFAIGFDRVMVALGAVALPRQRTVAVLSTPEGASAALRAASAFREAGLRTEVDLSGRGLGTQLARASRTADFAVLVGAREAEAGVVAIKDLASGVQETLPLGAAVIRAAGREVDGPGAR
ncbi:MAG TPA: histidine--tRNA ligase [Methanoregulaceae archaeon]|nr:histidine--tRNA ligase [Methanoregulaceae archaeon]